MIKTRIISSLEKVFPDSSLDKFKEVSALSALRGERISVQLAYACESEGTLYVSRAPVTLGGSLAQYATVRAVDCVPVTMPTHPQGYDDNYLRTSPGLYPDVLRPLYYGGEISLHTHCTSAIWIEIQLPDGIKAGEHTLTVTVSSDTHGTEEKALAVEVIDALLPKEDIYFTQWFHADCLANYYNVEVWSDKHWEIVENFARVARKNGINMLLTPVFTPPLDTAVGGERRTTQLVGVTLRNGKYEFDFARLDRWVDMCDRCGIEYLEIAHLFTQWGAAHAPKIIVNVDGEDRKLFGWHTDAHSEEYRAFVRSFISALLCHMRSRGDDKRMIFHISDEPSIDHLESYRSAKETVADLLDGYLIVDALSKIDFYKKGVLEHPVCSNNHIAPFLEEGVKGLWTYYCVSQPLLVSNRYMSMPGWRNRSIGMQMYKYGIEGFLHWGYNFYSNQFSGDPINPYLETSADHAFPAGDSYSVYPSPDGTAYESTRLVVFYEALQDIKAMKLCESLYGHDAVVAAIEEELGLTLTFDTCAKSSEKMMNVRARINTMIRDKI